jgi:ribose transport system ATP-binding protein
MDELVDGAAGNSDMSGKPGFDNMNSDHETANTQSAGVLLGIENVVKTYGKTIALNDFSMQLNPGEIFGLIGGNGAGKSTLMRIVAGVTVPDSGKMFFHGDEVSFHTFKPLDAMRRGIRTVYQESSLCTNVSVYENFYIELHSNFENELKWRKDTAKLTREKLDEIFDDNGVDVNARIDTLSIAQRQMVEIAREFSDDKTKLLLLDEPTSSLPAERAQQLSNYIRKTAERGISFVYISHKLEEVVKLVDRLCILTNGRITFTGKPNELSLQQIVQRMGGLS